MSHTIKQNSLNYFFTFLFVTLLAACGGGSSSSPGSNSNTDTTPPAVSATSPANNATGFAVNAAITATFDENMTANTLSITTFTLKDASNNSVTGTVGYSGATATFTPTGNLANTTSYTATITTGAKDAAGNALATNYVWTFTTAALVPAIATGRLNDTGITAAQCHEASSNVLVACNGVGAAALSAKQDGMVGRDVDVVTNDNADGKSGFSFSSVAGGCVKDNLTGLMWEAKTNDGGLRDMDNLYTNFDSTATDQQGDGGNPTQEEIDAATNSIGFKNAVNGAGLCGFNDWRLPTAEELQSIVDYGATSPTIDATWFPNTLAANLVYYWTSSPKSAFGVDTNVTTGWIVSFYTGQIGYGGASFRGNTQPIRLVRGTPYTAAPRYTISADGSEVTDNHTKLIWRRCVEGRPWDGNICTFPGVSYLPLTHEAALAHAKTVATDTGIAWRLPNIKELTSIVDRSRAEDVQALDSTVFPENADWILWAATPALNNAANAWTVGVRSGSASDESRGLTAMVRLVRDAP